MELGGYHSAIRGPTEVSNLVAVEINGLGNSFSENVLPANGFRKNRVSRMFSLHKPSFSSFPHACQHE